MDYHSTDIHSRILRNIALNVELIYNDNYTEISEYDVQAFLSLFLRRYLKNTEFAIFRESFGKYDCAIAHKTKNLPVVLYEIKTYLKPKEKLQLKTEYNKIISDFEKLAKGAREYPKARGYFLLICRANHLENLSKKFDFIRLAKEGSRKWSCILEHEGKYRLRPSTKEVSIGRVRILSWEVKTS